MAPFSSLYHGADEGHEGWGKQGHDEECDGQEHCRGVRAQAERGRQNHLVSRRYCSQGGQIQRKVHLPRLLHGQDPRQASHQGWREGGLRQGGDGEGEACANYREGVPRVSFEEERLRLHSCYSSISSPWDPRGIDSSARDVAPAQAFLYMSWSSMHGRMS